MKGFERCDCRPSKVCRSMFWLGWLAASLTAPTVMAHKTNFSVIPVLTCWQDGSDVVCQSGWSTGSPLPKVPIEVIGRDGAVLAAMQSNTKGHVRFAMPRGEYTVVMRDARVVLNDLRDSGQTVELSWRDVRATPKPR